MEPHIAHTPDLQQYRWWTLILLVIAMAGGYMMLYALSPLQGLLNTLKGWSSADYSLYSAAEPFLNVFCGLLLVGGILLDRFGLRRTVRWACVAMLIGSGLNWFALANDTLGDAMLWGMPASVGIAALGFMVFGVGVELTGVAASRTTVRWFAGRELSLATGIQLACSRVAVAAGLWLSPRIALWGEVSVARPIAVFVGLIIVGTIAWLILCGMERPLTAHSQSAQHVAKGSWDVRPLLSNSLFWIVTAVVVLYYASVVPFYRYASLMLTRTVGLSTDDAATLLSVMPLAGALFTPVVCALVDAKGMALRFLTAGSAIVAIAYLLLTLLDSELWDASTSLVAAIAVMTMLAIGSAIASAAVWPLVPRIISAGDMGKGYALIYWLQNLGFMAMPLIAGRLMGADAAHYNYTAMTAAFAATALICIGTVVWLTMMNRHNRLGLNSPERR